MSEINMMKDYAYKNNVPIMQDEGIQFLCDLVKKRNCRSILECGTAIGYSSICMAKVNSEIKIDTCEINLGLIEIARKNIQEQNCENQIVVHHCDAAIFQTTKKYDLIFVDAAKAQYKKYMDHFIENLNEDGVFVFDNLNFHGLVDNPAMTKSRNTKALVRKIKNFRDLILTDENLKTSFYPNIGDGIAVVEVKKVL